jgi:hypothetical protein
VRSSFAVIATSPDGITWTKQINPDDISTYLFNVHHSTEKNTFIIIGDGKIYTCNFYTFYTEVEIQIVELDKRFSRTEPDYFDD